MNFAFENQRSAEGDNFGFGRIKPYMLGGRKCIIHLKSESKIYG